MDRIALKAWLTYDGWLAAILLGFIIAVALPLTALLFPFLFFILGSLLSKLNPKEKDAANGRNWKQVLSNGGVSGIIAILYFCTQNEIFLSAFILSFTIALSDTASSEIGKRISGKTYDIVYLKPIKVGLSGGVSYLGTLAGIIGAFLMAGVGYIFHYYPIHEMLLVALFGTVGMLLDSVLGSLFQAKYLVDDQLYDDGENVQQLVRGYSWVTNDLVNFGSIFLMCLLYFFVSY